MAEAFQSPCLTPEIDEEGVADRQDRVEGFSTAKLQEATILLVGAGGLGGEIGTSLARKGLGQLVFCDSDQVEMSNLNRQKFRPADLYQNKAIALARNVCRESCLGMRAIGHAVDFNHETAAVLGADVDLCICGVDNNYSRLVVSRYFGHRGVPVVFTAVNEAADFCWVFLQDQVSPCIGCIFPDMAAALIEREPCTIAPAIIDILKAAAALVSHAVDLVVMDRPRAWKYYEINLSGGAPNITDTPKASPGCPVCGYPEDSTT